jgi:hypothetical protein
LGGKGVGGVGLASPVVGGVTAATSAGPWACAGIDRNRVSAIATTTTNVLRKQFIANLLSAVPLLKVCKSITAL